MIIPMIITKFVVVYLLTASIEINNSFDDKVIQIKADKIKISYIKK